LVGLACGCRGSAERAPGAPTAATTDAAAPGTPAAEHPFAGSAAEATQLISGAVDRKSSSVQRCVGEYRKRKQLPRERVAISVGIDQEGHLIGVTLPKGQQDAELKACVQDALKDAPFPRSHSGVITITRTFEEIAQ
jgi:outer membrane biosynthesis protein TonB